MASAGVDSGLKMLGTSVGSAATARRLDGDRIKASAENTHRVPVMRACAEIFRCSPPGFMSFVARLSAPRVREYLSLFTSFARRGGPSGLITLLNPIVPVLDCLACHPIRLDEFQLRQRHG